jgi:hypothetical protein
VGFDATATVAMNMNRRRREHDLKLQKTLAVIGAGVILFAATAGYTNFGIYNSSSSSPTFANVTVTATGEIICTLTIDPERRYHGTGKPIGGPSRPYGPHKNKKSEP